MNYTATGLVSLCKRALIDALKADASVYAFVNGRVFDFVPQDSRGNIRAEFPYVYCGPAGARQPDSGPCSTLALDVRFRLFCTSSLTHREQAWDLAEAVIAALQDQKYDLGTGRTMSSLMLTDAGDILDQPDPVQVFADFTTRLQK